MTNREYLINQLSDPDYIDDSGASYEATVFHKITCPYPAGDERSLCYKKWLSQNRELCLRCKEKWLNSEVEE